jgi:hypothetical protein
MPFFLVKEQEHYANMLQVHNKTAFNNSPGISFKASKSRDMA